MRKDAIFPRMGDAHSILRVWRRGNVTVTSPSVEREHLANWIFAERITRYGLVPALLAAISAARLAGLPYPLEPCVLLFLWFFLYNNMSVRFLRRRSRAVPDHLVYLGVLLLDTTTLALAIHFTGGIESVLVPLTAVIVIFGTLFLTFFQCVLVSAFSALAYGAVLALEYRKLLPHYHIFASLSPTLYADTRYVTLTYFGVVAVIITLGLMAGHLATLRRRHSDRLAQMQLRLEEWNRDLELRVEAKTRTLRQMHEQLQQAYLQTITAFVHALGAKDQYTQGHSHTVATYARMIGEALGLRGARLQTLIQGCELHDVGKIAVPDTILLKPGPLTKEEFEIVKQHPVWGAKILEPLTFLKDVAMIVRQEHERWDGRGYPDGLQGEEIRLEARVVAVADAWDAMTSNRPYRAAMSREAAILELKRGAGTQFDPLVVDAFLQVLELGKLPAFAPIEDVTSHLHPDAGRGVDPSAPVGRP